MLRRGLLAVLRGLLAILGLRRARRRALRGKCRIAIGLLAPHVGDPRHNRAARARGGALGFPDARERRQDKSPHTHHLSRPQRTRYFQDLRGRATFFVEPFDERGERGRPRDREAISRHARAGALTHLQARACARAPRARGVRARSISPRPSSRTKRALSFHGLSTRPPMPHNVENGMTGGPDDMYVDPHIVLTPRARGEGAIRWPERRRRSARGSHASELAGGPQAGGASRRLSSRARPRAHPAPCHQFTPWRSGGGSRSCRP